jgi:putative ubiquitin-RnfH superfamily antitoxin RatB of RatAB toxin-antitoxin module
VSDRFEVEVAYATPSEQVILKVMAEQGITVQEAIDQSKIADRFPEIDPGNDKVGVFGKVAKRDLKLHPGDRVEIYRPLIADPKAVRKKRASEGAAKKPAVAAKAKTEKA